MSDPDGNADVGLAKPIARRTHMWKGQPIDELSREELLEVIEWCAEEMKHLRGDRDRWMRSGDALKYLLDPAGA